MVLEGEITVVLHTTQFNAKKGDSFYIPPKNYYNLINQKAREAELSLIQVNLQPMFWREFQILPACQSIASTVPVRRPPPHRQRLQPVGEAPASRPAAAGVAGIERLNV